jgi:hypothetical protein
MLQVVIDLSVKEQGLGGNATHVQAGASEFLFALDQGDFQPILPCADGGGVSPWTAAYDDHVVDCFCHSKLPDLNLLVVMHAKLLFYASRAGRSLVPH